MLSWRFPDKPHDTCSNFVENLRENEWLCSAKLDGWNASIYTDENQVATIFSRSNRVLKDVTNVPTFILEQVEALAKGIPPQSVINAEFVGPRGNHQPGLYVFDSLAWDGEWLSFTPFEKRWHLVETVVARHISGGIHLAETVDTDFMGLFSRLKKIWYDGGCSKLDLCEGIVLKRRTGGLTLDRNSSSKSRHQFKLKYREILEKRY